MTQRHNLSHLCVIRTHDILMSLSAFRRDIKEEGTFSQYREQKIKEEGTFSQYREQKIKEEGTFSQYREQKIKEEGTFSQYREQKMISKPPRKEQWRYKTNKNAFQ